MYTQPKYVHARIVVPRRKRKKKKTNVPLQLWRPDNPEKGSFRNQRCPIERQPPAGTVDVLCLSPPCFPAASALSRGNLGGRILAARTLEHDGGDGSS